MHVAYAVRPMQLGCQYDPPRRSFLTGYSTAQHSTVPGTLSNRTATGSDRRTIVAQQAADAEARRREAAAEGELERRALSAEVSELRLQARI
jgi:hypothetical protein